MKKLHKIALATIAPALLAIGFATGIDSSDFYQPAHAESHNLWVGGVEVTSDNQYGTNWHYYWDNYNQILELNGINFEGDVDKVGVKEGAYIRYTGYSNNPDLYIKVNGTNNIHVTNNGYGIHYEYEEVGRLYFIGNGTLNITSDSGTCIRYAGKNATVFESGTYNLDAYNSAVGINSNYLDNEKPRVEIYKDATVIATRRHDDGMPAIYGYLFNHIIGRGWQSDGQTGTQKLFKCPETGNDFYDTYDLLSYRHMEFISSDLYVGDEPVYEGHYSGTNWSYDKDTNNLTLSELNNTSAEEYCHIMKEGDSTLTYYHAYIFYCGEEDLTITLSGDNVIKGARADRFASLIYSLNHNAKLAFVGQENSSLTLETLDGGTATDDFCIISGGDLAFTCGTYNIKGLSYGITPGNYWLQPGTLIIESGVNLTVSGQSQAICIGYGGMLNSDAGTGYSAYDGTGTSASIPAAIEPQTIDAYKLVVFPIAHEHVWSYTANGAVVTASCTADECPSAGPFTFTLKAPTGSMIYDGQPRVATYESDSTEAFGTPTITYSKNGTAVSECREVGEYTAKVTFGNAVAQVSFKIEEWVIDDPTTEAAEVEIHGAPYNSDVSVRIEVKVSVKAEEVPADFEKIKARLEADEQIAKVYDVKLILTEGGIEREIQPTELDPNATVLVTMAIPEGAPTSGFRLLHIHNVDDMEFIDNFTRDGNNIKFSTNRLSEFAFITKIAASNAGGISGGAVAGIIIGILVLLLGVGYFLLFFIFNKWIIADEKVVRAFQFGKEDDKIRLFTMIFKKQLRVPEEVFDNKKDAEDYLDDKNSKK